MHKIKNFQHICDADLNISYTHGVAWQADMSITEDYGADYFNKCASYEGSKIADELNKCRSELVSGHYGEGMLVDVGIGSGEFIRYRPNTFGMDINPVALQWLRDNGKLFDDSGDVEAFSFWDVIEHIPEPEEMIARMKVGCYAFFSIPVFADLSRVRESKHYRPGEHLYYWTAWGFDKWMSSQGFTLLEHNRYETFAGRENIESFAFVRAF